VPFNFQALTPNVPKALRNDYPVPSFVITALAWDTNPLRNELGYRIRQDATVTLTQFIQDEVSAASSSAQRSHNTKGQKGKTRTVISAPHRDTALLIAIYVGSKDHYKAAREIVKANPKLHLRSVTSKIKHRTHVKVPVVL
jgi:hypothetical protein